MAKDPYTLLGVTRSASDAEIRKAYRALAKKYHPDVNKDDDKAGERFKEISAAYTLLSDKTLKSQYDNGQIDGSGQQSRPFAGAGAGRGYGQHGFGGFGGFGEPAGGFKRGEMEDLFSSLFGMQMRGAMGRGEGPQRRAAPKNGGDIRYKLSIGFLDTLAGATRKIRGADGKTLSMKIPQGVEDGQVLRLRGKGHPGQFGGKAGDAKVEVHVKPHKYFSKDGNTLHLKLPISLQEAVLGTKVQIPMPTGQVKLNIPAGTNSDTVLRLKGKGIDGGDMYVNPMIVLESPKDKSLKAWVKSHPTSPEFDPREKLTKD